MKTIIAGSRDLEAYKNHEPVWLVADACAKSGFAITEVVCGGARGIDLSGKLWAESKDIPTKDFNADWSDMTEPCLVRYRGDGKAYNALAGFSRNQDMADYSEALVLIWDGRSRGSADMLKRAQAKGLKIYQYIAA